MKKTKRIFSLSPIFFKLIVSPGYSIFYYWNRVEQGWKSSLNLLNAEAFPLLQPLSSDKLFFDSIRYRYDMRVFFSIRYDTIRYEGLKEDLLFEEFSANFRRIFRIFGEFSEFSANFRRIFRIFGEFSANFQNFRRFFGIFGEKRQKNHWF